MSSMGIAQVGQRLTTARLAYANILDFFEVRHLTRQSPSLTACIAFNICTPGFFPNSPAQISKTTWGYIHVHNVASSFRQMASCHQICRYHQDSKRLSSDRPWFKLCMVLHVQHFWVILVGIVGASSRAMRFSLLAAIIASLVNSSLPGFKFIL